MSKQRPIKSIPLSDAEEESLIELATVLGSYAKTGPTVGMPSWRRLVAEIAAGDFVIRRRAAPGRPKPAVVVDPPAVDVAPVTVSLPLWWPREDDGSLMAYAVVDGALAAECEAMGLKLTEYGFEAVDEWLAPD